MTSCWPGIVAAAPSDDADQWALFSEADELGDAPVTDHGSMADASSSFDEA